LKLINAYCFLNSKNQHPINMASSSSDIQDHNENNSACPEIDTSDKQLTQEQVQRVEKNRKRALEIKAAKENMSKM